MRKCNRMLAAILCMILLLGNLPAALAQEGDVVLITSREEFLEFAENCLLDSYSTGKVFRLITDIDLSDVEFEAIPVFGGTFDGNHHSITGLKITSAGSVKGLFRYLESTAIVRNLTVQGDIAPTGSRSTIAGIVGSNSGIIEGCAFIGTIAGAEYVGGIAGINLAGGIIRNCSANGQVSGKHFVGGIVGSNEGMILDCENKANVNITAQQNDIDISDITLGTLTNTESAAATTDIGGIAGSSSGSIRGCSNYGSIGYKHMGYNVGGIVGVQAGYVGDCKNYGAVSGRKEVGGIVGQQEPEVVLNYSTDTLQILKSQLAVLSDLVDRASANGSANAANIRNLIYKMEKYALKAEKAAEFLQSAVKNPKFEDLEAYADALKTINESIQGISNTLRKLWDAMDETMTDLDRDMAAISEQLAVIEETLNNAESNLGGAIMDISDQDTTDDLRSKVENCHNFGSVLADLNAGGIVGIIAFESDVDPEADITVTGETTLNAVGSLRSVIRSCSNAGSVTAKNQRIGGIVGWLSMGLVKDCTNTGAVDNSTADHVGGIAGASAGYIRNCKVRSIVSGNANVGGIAGSGSIVTDCACMVRISGTEKLGCILGKQEAPYHEVEIPIANNYYLILDQDPGGIDGISYEQKAKGLALDNFLSGDIGSDIFRSVCVTFIADGKVVKQVILPTGSAFTDIPDVPQVEDHVGFWEGVADAGLDQLLFDVTINATYTRYHAVIQSQQLGDHGRPILLLQGDFGLEASLNVNQLEVFSSLTQKQSLLQAWEFTAENCIALHTGRLLLDADVDTDALLLMVRSEDGSWSMRPFTKDGSYLVFAVGAGDSGIALLEDNSSGTFSADLLLAAAAGALSVLIIVLIVVAIMKRKRNGQQETQA